MDLFELFSALYRRIRQGGRAVAALGALAIAFFYMAPAAGAQDGEKSALQKIRQRGSITVAFYKENAPFSDDGKGIDVELAEALAAKLGVKMSPLWFHAGEKMDDDLRKMVWKGTPIGYGPADLMMHVPVDRQFMARVDQVKIFGPYHRERYAMGRRLEALPTLESLEPFAKLPFAAESESMGAMVMLSADGGRYRENLKIFRSAEETVAALKSGTVVAALAQQGELESGLAGDSRFAIEPPPHPVLRMSQWVVGMAVKAESEELAKALEGTMQELMADGTVTRIMERHGVKHRQP